MIICTCSRCVSKTCTDTNGDLQPGQFVSRRTQLKHHLADVNTSSDHESRSREDSPEPETVNLQELLAKQEGAAYEALHADGGDSLPTVITLVGLFLGWLHLYCGLSSVHCQLAQVFILRILETARDHPLLDDSKARQIPRDIRTTIKALSISPQLDKQICCPTCFTLYPPTGTPWSCSFKKSPQARECGEILFQLKKLYRHLRDKGACQQSDPSVNSNLPPEEIGHPRNLYVTQKLSSWLSWFLSKSTIEEDILKWSEELSKSNGRKIIDIQQSDAWKEITWPSDPSTGPKPLNLLFSLFIDWFNPRGNKRRGAQQSMGVFSYNCLDLPPSLRNLLQNTCVAGITPGPNAPDMTTISHVIKVHIDDLIDLEQGMVMPTAQYPEGRLVRVKLLTLLGDMVGMHKVAGFASHAATFFCSWCWISSKEVDIIHIGRPRTKAEVIETANLSKRSVTLSKKDDILRDTGVRWSEFNRLNYRDPVKHLPIGMMHNWFEGVLHHHFRYRWGFVLFSKEQKQNIKKKRQRDHTRDIDSLQKPSKRMMYEEGGGNAIDEDEPMDDGSQSSESEMDDVELEGGWDGGLFSKNDIIFFRRRLCDVVLPTGIPRMPPNLGEAKAGSLKATQWHSLFAYVIPLVILELYVTDVNELKKDSNRGQILLNIGNLCQCTNVVCAKEVSDYEAKTFETFYRKYHQTSKRIFTNLSTVPNHHYALHITEQIRRWGPLISVAEFSGERLIGVLQKIPTNKRIAQMDGTMMSRFSQWQRLNGNYAIIEEVMSPYDQDSKRDPRKSRYRIQLELPQYTLLLDYSQAQNPQVRHYQAFPHPPNALVLPPYAIPRSKWRISKRLVITVLKPNNCIQFSKNGKIHYGIVRQIYEFQNAKEKWETVCIVDPIENLYPKDLQSSSHFFRYLLFLLTCVVGQISTKQIVVSPDSVLCVSAYRLLPADVFGIKEHGIILRPYDYRSQLDV